MYLPQWFVASLALFRSTYQPGEYSNVVVGSGHSLDATTIVIEAYYAGSDPLYLDYEKAEEGSLVKL